MKKNEGKKLLLVIQLSVSLPLQWFKSTIWSGGEEQISFFIIVRPSISAMHTKVDFLQSPKRWNFKILM